MLATLRVRNFAIINELDISFGPGLNVLTGETGAGKSVLIGALGIVLGGRGYIELIRTGAEEATVEAFFDLPANPVLAEMGIPVEDGILIRRTIARSGRGKAFVNDVMVSVQALATLGDTLVDVHGQHEHQSLLNMEHQMDVLDSYGGLLPLRQSVGARHEEVRALERRLGEFASAARQRVQKLDLLRFQVDEIIAASLEPDEDVRLEEEREILANLARLNELVEDAHARLYSSDGAALEQIDMALGRLGEMSAIDQGAAEVLDGLGQARALVEDAAFRVRDLRARYDLDPARLDEVEERLQSIGALKRKYGATVADVLQHLEQATRELEELQNVEETTAGLERELKARQDEYASEAKRLSADRLKAARKLADAAKAVLKDLAFQGFDFKIDLSPTAPSATGTDTVEFLFTANKGEALKPLAKVASGGELSRIMLALKSVMREADEIPVLVFDEVDAGIGGKTALNVAAKLRQSAEACQVFCITHLPQIAAVASGHYLISKSGKGKQGKEVVEVEVTRLDPAARQQEIARMLSGSITSTSLKHARELMDASA